MQNLKLNVLVKLFLFSLLFVSCNQKEEEQKPDIILINIDDMGWRDVGFMGSEYYETPNIDELAKQGMIFTNGYAAAANCAPSRACLMTSKWTPRHGIYTVGTSERGKSQDRKIVPTKNKTTLDTVHTIIPQILKKNGYQTCIAGKWHLSENPLEYGFDRNIGGGNNGHPNSYYAPFKNVNLEADSGKYLTDLIMEKAMEFVDTVSSPFFLYYSPYAVHKPIHAVDSIEKKYLNKPAWNGQSNTGYASMVENLDRNIALLISKLKEKDAFKNSLIILTSDNGGLYGITEQKPLRAGKGSYYEGGIREPFFFVWEGKIQPNKISEVPVSNLDLLPTILKSAGIDIDKSEYDGEDLLPVLRGESSDMIRPMFWHFPIYLEAYNVNDNENRDSLFRTRPGSVIRYGDWKLHHYFEDDGIELYNLKDDIGERNNLVKSNPEKTKELLELLSNWREKVNAPIPKELNSEFKDN